MDNIVIIAGVVMGVVLVVTIGPPLGLLTIAGAFFYVASQDWGK